MMSASALWAVGAGLLLWSTKGALDLLAVVPLVSKALQLVGLATLAWLLLRPPRLSGLSGLPSWRWPSSSDQAQAPAPSQA